MNASQESNPRVTWEFLVQASSTSRSFYTFSTRAHAVSIYTSSSSSSPRRFCMKRDTLFFGGAASPPFRAPASGRGVRSITLPVKAGADGGAGGDVESEEEEEEYDAGEEGKDVCSIALAAGAAAVTAMRLSAAPFTTPSS